MKRIVILNICFIAIIFYFSCNKNETKGLNNIDSVLLLKIALNHILKQDVLPKEYYSQPLQLIKPKGFNQSTKIVLEGRECVMLPEGTLAKDILSKMDIYKPIPLAELVYLKSEGEFIYIEIIFRSTGHDFLLQLKRDSDKKFQIIRMNDKTI